MSAPAASVESEPRGNHVVVRITGELDVFNAESVSEEIEQAIPTESHGVAVDLTAVGFLDSTAIRKLFGLSIRLAEHRQRIVIVTPNGSTVHRTLQLVDFARTAPIHDTLDEALEALAS